MEKERSDRAPYGRWAEEGYVRLTPGRAVDKRDIARFIGELSREFDLVEVAYDPWDLVEMQRLFDEEGLAPRLTRFGQRYEAFSPAIAALEKLIVTRELKHGADPVLRWAFSNLVVDHDMAGHRKFTKTRARDRIDPMIALTMAVGRAVESDPAFTLADDWIFGVGTAA